MASAWGDAWGAYPGAWGDAWGEKARPSVGGGISGGTFSRKKWNEIKAALEALNKAEEVIIEIEQSEKRLEALHAARLAELAIDMAGLDAQQAQIEKLTKALNSAAGAGKSAAVVVAMRRVEMHARAIIKALDDEDEAEIEALLFN